MSLSELKEFLDEKVELYNQPKFIESDPIQIPHSFSKKEDIEISGFLTASIAWGNRTMIIKNANRMMEILENSPHDFILNHSESDLEKASSFVHRTFNSYDFQFFIKSLQNIYNNHKGLENVLLPDSDKLSYKEAISNFKQIFFSISHLERTKKHISDPLKNSAAKRINMYLRWMVRNDNKGVDFGIWDLHNSSKLSCPLDVHSGKIARKLKLLKRKQNDWKAVSELDASLRKMNVQDPAKYDFALFGLGVFEKF